jgi:hypothetical protein
MGISTIELGWTLSIGAFGTLVWGDFPSLHFWFYKVIMLGSTNATSEGKNASVILDVKLRL